MSKYNVPMDLSLDSVSGKLMNHIKQGSTVLEFGCAEGRMTQYMSKQLQCSVYVVEIDADALKNALQYAIDGVYGDAESLLWVDKYKDIRFDVVIFADVLEHLRKPEAVISKAAELLKDDGQVLISIPNIGHVDILCSLYNNHFKYTDIGLLDNTHIHFWGERDLDSFAHAAGFIITEKDAVYKDAFTTEQKDKAYDVPYEVAFLMKQKKDAYVYQYVLALNKTEWVKENKISSISYIKQKTDVFATAYFNTGNGYNENEKKQIIPESIPGKRTNCYAIEIPENCISVRFDPIEGTEIILYDLKVNSDKGPLKAHPINGYHFGLEDVFIDLDPQLEIRIVPGCKWLNIEVAIIPLLDQPIIIALRELQHLNTTTQLVLSKRKLQIEKLEKKHQEELEKCKKSYHSMLMSAHEEAKERFVAEIEEKNQQIQNIQIERNAENDKLRQIVAEKEEEGHGLYASLKERDLESDKLRQIIADKEEEGHRLYASLKERDLESEKLRQIIADKEEEGRGLYTVLAERNEESDKLKLLINEAVQKCYDLDIALKDKRDECENLNQKLQKLLNEQFDLLREMEKQKEKILDLETDQNKYFDELTQKKMIIHSLTEENIQCTQMVHCVYNSKSWRITKPLRELSKLLRKDKD